MPKNEIPLTPVTSSQIEAIGYDPQTQTAAIKFKGGGVYHYAGVSQADFDALQNAPSKYSHFQKLKGITFANFTKQ